MRRHGNLWERIISIDNLYQAYIGARKGKRWQRGVQQFEKNIFLNLLQLQINLDSGNYKVSEYRSKKVWEPKERDIYVLPFYPDRIVQHAILQILIPIWDSLFIDNSYSCRPGRGMHKASTKLMEYIRKNKYFLKCDIRKFYPSIDHSILKKVVREKIKCTKTLDLLDCIIDSFPGEKNTPIGNYSSQWFGNLYMNVLDQWLIHHKHVRHYLRYNDDFIIFSNNKSELNSLKDEIQIFIKDKLDLQFSKWSIAPVTQGVDFVGYRHFRDFILVRKSTSRRIKRRIHNLPHLLVKNKISREQYLSSIASTEGWLKWANSHNLKASLNLDILKRS